MKPADRLERMKQLTEANYEDHKAKAKAKPETKKEPKPKTEKKKK